MNILVACEESQAVTIELRKLGHIAFSCDVQECSGGHPEWHIQGDVIPLLKYKWDMIIAFPPCTYLTFAGNRHLSAPGRLEKREEAARFFMRFVNAECNHIAIENPLGYMSSFYRKPDQIIHPYMFGDPFQKRTCLWLKNLPLLEPTYFLPKPDAIYVDSKGKRRNWVETRSSSDRQKIRSKTFPGIAEAMAFQFTNNFYL
ncbi:MAG: hypothetical protein E7507_01370 [Ruminococcus sp.]|nr:hypothetical protein [Ruminococcus sp.]